MSELTMKLFEGLKTPDTMARIDEAGQQAIERAKAAAIETEISMRIKEIIRSKTAHLGNFEHKVYMNFWYKAGGIGHIYFGDSSRFCKLKQTFKITELQEILELFPPLPRAYKNQDGCTSLSYLADTKERVKVTPIENFIVHACNDPIMDTYNECTWFTDAVVPKEVLDKQGIESGPVFKISVFVRYGTFITVTHRKVEPEPSTRIGDPYSKKSRYPGGYETKHTIQCAAGACKFKPLRWATGSDETCPKYTLYTELEEGNELRYPRILTFLANQEEFNAAVKNNQG